MPTKELVMPVFNPVDVTRFGITDQWKPVGLQLWIRPVPIKWNERPIKVGRPFVCGTLDTLAKRIAMRVGLVDATKTVMVGHWMGTRTVSVLSLFVNNPCRVKYLVEVRTVGSGSFDFI